jgi:hypothetical protein
VGFGWLAPAVGFGTTVLHQGKTIMKRSLLIAALLVFGLGACGDQPKPPPPPPPPVPAPAPAPVPVPVPPPDMKKDEMKDEMKKEEMKK